MIQGRALVTGATGFVGSHLTRRLVHEGLEVHVLRRERSDFWRMRDVLPAVQTHVADVRDAAALRTAITAARPEWVFHLAAATVVAGASGAARELIDVNLLGSANLLDACRDIGLRGLVTTGDSFEYTPSMGRLSEDSACHPGALHGITKLAATLCAGALARERGLPIVTLRLFSTYGPADHPRRVVPRIISGALAGTELLLSRPEIARDWVYVGDVVDLYLEAAGSAASRAGGVFNAGSGVPGSLGDLTALILRLTGSTATARWGAFPAPPHDDHPWIADPSLTFSHFAWRPKVSLEEGLARTIAAFREDREGRAR